MAILAYSLCTTIVIAVQTLLVKDSGFELSIAFVDSAISGMILGFLSFMTGAILKYYQPRTGNWMNLLVINAALTAAWYYASDYCLHLYPFPESYFHFFEATANVRILFVFFCIGWVILTTWLLRYISERRESDERKNTLEQLAREAELIHLRQQLQPHFLFNSLNSISSLTLSKPEEARRMIELLSTFLRGTLAQSEQQRTSLQEELEQIQRYLEIERIRFGNRLSIHTEIGPEAKDCQLPIMLLQPLVENAIKFGVYGTVGEVVIELSVHKQNDSLNISISNPYDQDSVNSRQGTGFGLSSIQRRLYLVFGRNDLLQTQSTNERFTAILKIPL